MYSRKFGQNGLPPDYSGVSFRQPPAVPEAEPDCSPPGTPRYPTEDRRTPIPSRRFTVKRPPRREEKKHEPPSPPPAQPSAPSRSSGFGLSALASHSFTMEDIVLAGLILLLLNSDCDSELLLILGFLLLVGLQ